MRKKYKYIYILLTISSKSRFETRISIYNILKQETTAISFILKVYSIKKRKRRISNKNILFTYIAFDYTLTKKKKKTFAATFARTQERFDSGFEWYCLLLQFAYLFIRWYLRARSNGENDGTLFHSFRTLQIIQASF